MLIPFYELLNRHKIPRPSGVLHLGANTGQEAEAYADLGINRVIWVEALPELYRGLVAHLNSSPRFKEHRALQACISDQDGKEATFHVANNGGQSSSILEFGTHLVAHPSVRYVREVKMTTKRVDTLLRENDIVLWKEDWFLNIDLQGAELLALRGMGDLLSYFSCAYIEVNKKPLYIGCPMVREIDAWLLPYGLVGVEEKMTGAGWGDKFYRRL